MYPVVRFGSMMAKTAFRKPLGFDEVSEVSFITRPWDLDFLMEMNNGRALTLYDIGRFDLAVRCGLIKALRQNKWGLIVAGSSIRYRRRITLFEKVTIRSKALGYDKKWLYLSQSMWVKGVPASNALYRTCVTENRKAIDASRVAEALGATGWNPELPEWVKAWDEADNLRDWPPDP